MYFVWSMWCNVLHCMLRFVFCVSFFGLSYCFFWLLTEGGGGGSATLLFTQRFIVQPNFVRGSTKRGAPENKGLNNSTASSHCVVYCVLLFCDVLSCGVLCCAVVCCAVLQVGCSVFGGPVGSVSPLQPRILRTSALGHADSRGPPFLRCRRPRTGD